MTGINPMRGRLTRTRIDPGLMVAGVCLLCAIAGWMFSDGIEVSEFGGGRITGARSSYFIAPRPFRALFPGPRNVLASSSFVWNTAAIAAILLVGIAAGISVRTVRRPGAEIGATV
jgi:hypothetical protein